MTHSTVNPLWGGHYNQGPAEIMQQINQSISFDKQLYRQDIQASLAHCEMLVKQNILSSEEGKAIIGGLGQILQEIESGNFVFKEALEDIHMNVEGRLHELIGEVAGKLHTARSRNDQVATDFRLWVRDALDIADQALESLQMALLSRAEEYLDIVMPGFTHLQTAQPVTLAHHLMAYVEMVKRDRSRIRDGRARLNECPLGAAALAGTSFPIDRFYTAKALGFERPMANSLDAVSDRDFALELIATASISAMHLSRLAEEFVIWASAQFKFISFTEAFTSGSSIMPQKRNPDAAELVRAKTGRITGHFSGLLMVMKGLVLAYSKDMQEDKEPVFDTVANWLLCIRAMTGMVKDFSIYPDRLKEAANHGYSTATDLADWLVKHLHLPFRQCHHITGKIVRLAESKQCRLQDLTLEEMQSIEPRMTAEIFSVLSVENSVHSRNSYGGTAPVQVKEQISSYFKKA